MDKLNKKWDFIIIGSGVGGLTLGALLSQLNKSVLVLEKHYTVGGFTHTFNRKNRYTFDTGLHYIGNLEEGSHLRQILNKATNTLIEWKKNPHFFEILNLDEQSFRIPSDRTEFLASLVESFPEEERALKEYFTLQKKVAQHYISWQMLEKKPQFLEWIGKRLISIKCPEIKMTTADCLKRIFKNKKLLQLLTMRWLGFGEPPETSSFAIHCLQAEHYSQGAWYPKMGSQKLADSLEKTILSKEGLVLTRTQALEIKTAHGSATEVLFKDKNKDLVSVSAPIIISNIGSRNTYTQLVKHQEAIDAYKNKPSGSSLISLFLGFQESPTSLGVNAANYWFEIKDQKLQKYAYNSTGSPIGFISFSSLKKEQASQHTAQFIFLTNHKYFSQYQAVNQKRSKQYQDLKTELTENILKLLEEQFPGIRNLIDFQELSTPLTVENFVSTPKGSIYGFPSRPERLLNPWCKTTGPISNLYQVGCDSFAPGIAGAIFSAQKCFDIIRKKNLN